MWLQAAAVPHWRLQGHSRHYAPAAYCIPLVQLCPHPHPHPHNSQLTKEHFAATTTVLLAGSRRDCQWPSAPHHWGMGGAIAWSPCAMAGWSSTSASARPAVMNREPEPGAEFIVCTEFIYTSHHYTTSHTHLFFMSAHNQSLFLAV